MCPVESGEIVDRVVAPGIEQVIEDAIRHLRRLHQPPVRLFEDVATGVRVHQIDRTRLEAALLTVLLIKSLHANRPINRDILQKIKPDRVVVPVQTWRIGNAIPVNRIQI
ncbi:MAG: hypothetical protein HC834_06835 [Rhodospirillales bacterium]|nr:hypothetical protein [Rhodospirillales bacterium]